MALVGGIVAGSGEGMYSPRIGTGFERGGEGNAGKSREEESGVMHVN